MSQVNHLSAVYLDGMITETIEHAAILEEQQSPPPWRLTELADDMSRAGNLFTPDLKQRLEFRNAASNGSRIPCFALKVTAVSRALKMPPAYPVFRSPVHDFRVQQLCDMLNERASWDVVVGPFKNEQTVLELNGYVWTIETTRIYSPRGCVRHDIVGQQLGNRLLPTTPAVAIEVVKGHWPSQGAFDDMLLQSATSTLVVMFDLVDKNNTALKVFPSLGFIKPAVYIADGSVCRNGQKLLIRDRSNLNSNANAYKEILTPAELEMQVAAAVAKLTPTTNQQLVDFLNKNPVSTL